MKKLWLLMLAIVGILGTSLLTHRVVIAACNQATLGIPHWYRGLVNGDCTVKSPEEFKTGDDDSGMTKYVTIIVLNVADMLLRLVGLVSFGLILYSGFVYVTSTGLAQRVESAKKTLQNAVIGLVIALLATAIVNFVFGLLKGN